MPWLPRQHAQQGTQRSARATVALVATGVVLGLAAVWFARRGLSTTPASKPVDKAPSGAWFVNVTDRSGIDFVHVSGAGEMLYMPEIMAGGVALIDFDRDGAIDVYFAQGGYIAQRSPDAPPGNKLYRNRGDGTFEDVTASAGVGDTGYGMGCACADFDNDGFTDIYVTNAGPNVLYKNNGDGTFTDVTAAAGVGSDAFGASAAFFDYDRDEHLDLMVVNYIRWSPQIERKCGKPGARDYCLPTLYDPAPDDLYHNNGDGTFTDAADQAGTAAMFGNGLGLVAGDFNGDGWVDVCVANDEMANQLWINQQDGTFRDEALERGLAFSGRGEAEAGMGIDAQDLNGDGLVDIVMTHFWGETNTFYINRDGYFEDSSRHLGLSPSRPYTGFGTAIIDLNNDGMLDMYVANGRVVAGKGEAYKNDPYAEPNQLYAGQTDGTFVEVSPQGGTDDRLVDASRGTAFGDYDNDGDVDIIVFNRDAPPYVLENRSGSGNHWITFRVLNRHGSDAIGARVRVDAGGRSMTRDVRTAFGYCTSNDPRVHFGLGGVASVEDVVVTWPDGSTDSFGPMTANRIVDLRPQRPATGGPSP